MLTDREGVAAIPIQSAYHERFVLASQERQAALVRSVSAYGIYLIDRDARVRSWNQGAVKLTGFDESEVVGKPFARLFAPPALNEHVPERALQFAREHGHHHEEQVRSRKNGDVFTALVTLDAVRAGSGELIGFIEVVRDITEQKQREEALYRRATRDALTGVFVRGHFMDLAAQEIARARRFAEPLSLALLDIDHFKQVNDTYGHEIGDLAIIALTDTCVANIRRIDAIGRIGGEEFAILLPRANKEPALEMAQQLRLKVAEIRLKAQDATGEAEFGFTVSIGIASLRAHTRDVPELLRNADAALYKAKREGRNRVEAWFE